MPLIIITGCSTYNYNTGLRTIFTIDDREVLIIASVKRRLRRFSSMVAVATDLLPFDECQEVGTVNPHATTESHHGKQPLLKERVNGALGDRKFSSGLFFREE